MGYSVPTFADVIIVDGIEKPCDPNLHAEVDNMTKMALDYIFWLKPLGGKQDQDNVLEISIEETKVE